MKRPVGTSAAIIGLSVLLIRSWARTPMVEPIWTFQPGSGYVEEPVVDNGIVYVLFSQTSEHAPAGRLYALDSVSGKELWAHDIDGVPRFNQKTQWGPHQVGAEGLVFFKTRDGYLHALAGETGEEQWRSAGVYSLLAVSEGKVYILDEEIHYAILDIKDGRVLKRTPVKGDEYTRVTIAKGKLYLLNNRTLLATDLITGAHLWTYQAKHGIFAPLVGDGIIYLGSKDIFALDSATGREIWSVNIAEGYPQATDQGNVYFAAHGGRTHQRSTRALDGKTGKELSAIGHDSLQIDPYGKLVIADGVIYARERIQHDGWDFFLQSQDDDHWLSAVDSRTGKKLWSSARKWEDLTDPVVVGGIVYIGSHAKKEGAPSSLYAFRVVREASPHP